MDRFWCARVTPATTKTRLAARFAILANRTASPRFSIYTASSRGIHTDSEFAETCKGPLGNKME